MITTKMYFHADKSGNAENGREMGLEGAALDKFVYAGYEVGITIEIDEKTGHTFATHFQGAKLEKKVRITH
jgi:hypothetical protein